MSWECDPKMDTQMGPDLYGPGTKVSWYLENFIRICLAMDYKDTYGNIAKKNKNR